jgi:WD40 repeat protein
VLSVVFSPDGKRVLAGLGDGTAFIFDAESGAQLLILKAGREHVTAAFSPDGKLVATAANKTARIFDAETGAQTALLTGHKDQVFTVMFSPDGKRLLTASLDDTARIWDIDSGKDVAVLEGNRRATMKSAAFSPDGRRVVTASFDATARIWRVFATTRELVDDAKRAAPRCLTPAERESAYLDPAPPAWCVEMGKWPYTSEAWKSWLAQKSAGQSPPLPEPEDP